MRNVTIAVDIAKNMFEIAISAAAGQIRERRRMQRAERASHHMAERSDRRRGKAVNKRVPPEAAAAIGTRRANSMLARSREAPHQRPYIRLQPVPCRCVRDALSRR